VNREVITLAHFDEHCLPQMGDGATYLLVDAFTRRPVPDGPAHDPERPGASPMIRALVGWVQVDDRGHPRVAARPAGLLDEPPHASGRGLIDADLIWLGDRGSSLGWGRPPGRMPARGCCQPPAKPAALTQYRNSSPLHLLQRCNAFAFGAGDGNRTGTVSLGTDSLQGHSPRWLRARVMARVPFRT
jgi:hypothetical protein